MPFFIRAARFLGLVFPFASLFLPQSAHAQKYITAAGLRLGGGNYGLTVQQKIFEKTTLEGLALAGSRELSATVLAERHFGILGPSLNYYLGAGAHVGTHKDDGTFGGVDGIIGAEYKLPITRLLVAVDFKPSIEFGSSDWARFPTAFSVRYILIKDKNNGLFNGLIGGDDRRKRREKRAKEKAKEERKSQRKGLFNF